MWPCGVPGVEEQLLLDREAPDPETADNASRERFRWVAERWQVFDVGLPARVLPVEDNRVKVHPALGRCSQLNSSRPPVGLHVVADTLEDAEGSLG